jgi:hypothetical protein
MKYYITTPEIAQGISAIEAQKRGCQGVTAFWWSIINHPTNGQSALIFTDLVNPLYENGNTKIFESDLKDQAYMESQGWFVKIM